MSQHLNKESANLLLGIKIKKYRTQLGLSLADLAEKSGLSPSYISEIEKGKKYPKLDKMIALSKSLEVSYDELTALSSDNEEFNNFHTTMLGSFPFQQFGIKAQDLLEVVNHSDDKLAAFIRTLHDMSQMYDTKKEVLLLTALRSFQYLHKNYFEALEEKAETFRKKFKSYFSKNKTLYDSYSDILTDHYKYKIKPIDVGDKEELDIFRSIYVKGEAPRLFINKKLSHAQHQFLLAKEIGYCVLNLQNRSVTSPDLDLNSFEYLLNSFKAGYFGGALLMNQDKLKKDLSKCFSKSRWSPDMFWSLIEKYEVTPETFFHRVSQLLPTLFGIDKICFLRLHHKKESNRFLMTKELNFTEDFTPDYFKSEHYCRRWTPIKELKKFHQNKHPYVLYAERVQKENNKNLYFNITYVHSSSIRQDTDVSFTLGLLCDDNTKNAITFWNDPTLPTTEVNETCEKCPLTESQCQDRVAPPIYYDQAHDKEQTMHRLQTLIDTL